MTQGDQGIDGKGLSRLFDWLFGDVLHVLPELFRFIFAEDDRSIVRGTAEIHFHGSAVMPHLAFAMSDDIQVQRSVSDPNEMHESLLE